MLTPRFRRRATRSSASTPTRSEGIQ
jgi:hypothetical protein